MESCGAHFSQPFDLVEFKIKIHVNCSRCLCSQAPLVAYPGTANAFLLVNPQAPSLLAALADEAGLPAPYYIVLYTIILYSIYYFVP